MRVRVRVRVRARRVVALALGRLRQHTLDARELLLRRGAPRGAPPLSFRRLRRGLLFVEVLHRHGLDEALYAPPHLVRVSSRARV